MLQSQTKILDGAWERNPTLGSLAGHPAVVLAAVEPSLSLSVGPLPAFCLIDVDLQVQHDSDSERFLSLPQLTSAFEHILYLFFAWF